MRVVGSVEINRPASQVWAYVADYGNDPSWRAAVTQMRPSVVGAAYLVMELTGWVVLVKA